MNIKNSASMLYIKIQYFKTIRFVFNCILKQLKIMYVGVRII